MTNFLQNRKDEAQKPLTIPEHNILQLMNKMEILEKKMQDTAAFLGLYNEMKDLELKFAESVQAAETSNYPLTDAVKKRIRIRKEKIAKWFDGHPKPEYLEENDDEHEEDAGTDGQDPPDAGSAGEAEAPARPLGGHAEQHADDAGHVGLRRRYGLQHGRPGNGAGHDGWPDDGIRHLHP